MRALTYLMMGAIAAQGVVPVAAVAQPRQDRIAMDACAGGVEGEVRSQFPQAYDVVLTTRQPQPVGRDETQVVGRGEFQDRNGGAARFDYGCTYNARSNATYALNVHDVKPLADPNAKKKDNSAAIAGLLLGAVIAGAVIASSKDKDRDRRDRRDDTWSPSPGVRCSTRESACYENGRYSKHWTRRVFVR